MEPRALVDLGAFRAVAGAARDLLAQQRRLVEAVGDGAYCAESARIRGGTIGKHVRHVLDHYRAALDAAEGEGVISYDDRRRNVPMERDRAAAIRAIDEVSRRVAALDPATLERPVRVLAMLDGDGGCAELESTLAREMAFATHHGVHHGAMIRAIAEEFGARVDGEFGTAPSTVRHQRLSRAGGS